MGLQGMGLQARGLGPGHRGWGLGFGLPGGGKDALGLGVGWLVAGWDAEAGAFATRQHLQRWSALYEADAP